jgi:DNA sulfur modification protein DndD
MKLTQITLENFRQHKKVEIELDSSRSSFTIIKGRNGAGKTNLLKAITWALTGKLAKDEAKFDPISLVSISSASAAKEGDILEVSVRLDLDLGGGKFAQIERVARFVKSGTGARDLSHSSTELSVLTLEDKLKGYQKEPSPELWVEKVFPDRFSHYFLFDGEHLHRFFKDTEAVHVKRAVLEIANIDQLEKIVEHLSTVNQSLVKEAGSVAGVKGEELRKTYEYHETKIQEIEKELQEKKSLKIDLDEELTIAREKMGDIAAIQKDISLRNQLEKSAQSASDRAAEAKRELSAWAFKVGPAIMLSNQLQKLQDEIDAAREKRVLPPDYKPEALIELLKSGSCICGRGLEKDTDACTHVEKLLAEFSDLSEIGSALSELQQPLQFVSGQIDSSPNTLKSTQERIKSALKDESEAMSQLNVIQQKLSSSDDAQVAFIANRHEDAKRALETVLMQIGSFERQLQEQKERLESVRKEIETEAAAPEICREHSKYS